MQGKHFFGLDMGLPVEQLKQPMRNLLASLESAEPALVMETIVVDNASTDDSLDQVSERFPNVKLIRNPARDQANAAVRDAEKTLAAAERGLAVLPGDPGPSPAARLLRIAISTPTGCARARRAVRRSMPSRGSR